jgi:L-ascorbate metabolism protein UlaG (beta-lactamase superfamily)
LKHYKNPTLKTIKADWPGNLADGKDRFINHEFPFTPNFADVLRWMLTRNPQKQEKKEDTFRLNHVADLSFLHHQQDCIIWLGHASFFIRLGGKNVLIDPVFFDVPFIKRYTNHAFSPALFTALDYLLISHDHQDHCQEKSIRLLVKQNPKMKILTGLNMESLLRPWCRNLSIEMAGWYQQYETQGDVSIFYLPARHWSKRGLSDENKRLWGAFCLQSKDKTVYFSADSGYGSHFKEVKTLFPTIDVAIIGVGAYKPEWFMHPNHASPHDAVRAFNEMEAKIFIPMHYGTFDISDEPVGEPLRILQTLERSNQIDGTLFPLQLGECFRSF